MAALGNELQNDAVVPLRPLESECCGSGCNPCILDLYEQELKLSRKKELNNLTSSKLCVEHYTEFVLMDIVRHTCSTNLYRFQLPDGQILGHKAGQHLVIRANLPENPQVSFTRQYSILSSPDSTKSFDLLIKLYDKGHMSSVIKDWKPGDKVCMRGPFGAFKHSAGRQKRLLLICQGTGVVPLVSVIKEILDNEDDETWIRMVYSVKCFDEILAKETLEEFCNFWNFSLKIFSSVDPGASRLYGPNKDIVGCRLTKSLLASELGPDTYVLLCGSKDYMNTMVSHLQELGVHKDEICRF